MTAPTVQAALNELACYAPTTARIIERHLQGRGGNTDAECVAMLDTPAAGHITPSAMAVLRGALTGGAR